MRKLPQPLARVATWLAVAMSLFHLYAVLIDMPEPVPLRGTHLLFATVLILLLYPLRSQGEEAAEMQAGARSAGDSGVPWYDWGLIALAIVSIGYLFVNYEYISTRVYYADAPRTADMILGPILVLLVLEVSRRSIGWALPATALLFIAYAYAGPYLPDLFKHPGFTTEILVDQLYLTTEGVFGLTLGVSATYVILFVIFGAFLEKSGAGQFFTDFASSLTGGARGGPGKISVVSSSLFGTISGSAVANVMVDGWLTIPLMKKAGFRAPFAAAIEATASTGGQIMPPVMGAAAFVMAEFLNLPYIEIAKHAAIPAVLYYVALFFSIHFEALKSGLQGVPREELPNLREVVLNRGHLFIPVFIILGLMIFGYTATYAAIWASGAVVLLSWARVQTGMRVPQILQALENGSKQALGVAAACACAGIVIGVIALTGVGLRFTSLVLAVAGGSLVPALVLTMLAGIVLGMGMPTTPAYIVQAALLIPALIRLGVDPVAAHMFVFYFACISAITPPVAMAVYAAASIGKANLWEAGIQAVKVGAAGFIVPFMFVFGPSLLLKGSVAEVTQAAITSTIGAILLAAGLAGYFLKRTLWWERLLLIAAALLLIDPGLTTDLIGLACLGVVTASQYLVPRPAAPVIPPAGSAAASRSARG